MSLKNLQERLAEMPMLKLLPAVVAGILVQEALLVPMWGVVALALLCGVGAILLHRSYLLLLFAASVGYLSASLQAKPTPFPIGHNISFVAVVTDDSTPRTRTNRTEARIERWQDPLSGETYRCDATVWLYTDTLTTLTGGERLLITERVRPINYGSAQFRTLMRQRGLIGSCFLTHHNVERLDTPKHPSLHVRASRLMQRRLKEESERAAVVSAMTVGNRNRLSASLREDYARSGTAHLLAVSGLHTGILFLWVNLALWWLPLFRHGHRLRNLVAIAAVWLFVAAAGFPISAVRAAVMCTLLQWALFTSSHYRATNSWAAAALILLLMHPSWLFDVSFQLSFVAVGGLLVWGVPLCRKLHTPYRLLNGLLDALCISLVASLVTAPLTSYHFGLFSLVGLLLNPLMILLGSGIVAIGVALLLLPPLAPLLRPLVLMLAEWQNALAAWGATQAGWVVEYRLANELVIAFYLILLLLTLTAWCWDRKKGVHL
ncbi:MAG: ComEC/Rec2 family competence protein [Rikenellaceae bacterium]|nr:ComEC/Rec2 family competence protein [Rikenellaceae bacterium]